MARAARHPGVIVHRLLWSMAHGRAVRITLRSGAGKRIAKVVRLMVDPRRDTKNAGPQNSTVVVELEGGEEVAVNSMERVQIPVGDSGAAFAEGE